MGAAACRRTTNAAEGFHSDFNKQFNSSHPNIHALVEGLLLIQNQSYITINAINKGIPYEESKFSREKRFRSVSAWMEVLRCERVLKSYLHYMRAVYSNK